MNWKFWEKSEKKRNNPDNKIPIIWNQINNIKIEPPKTCIGCIHVTECKYYYSKCSLYLRGHSKSADNRVTCPRCGSKNTLKTYGDRFECKECGKVFS